MFDVGIGEMNSCQTKRQFMAAYSGRDCSLYFLRLWWPCERASRHPRGGSPRRRSRHSRMRPRRCSRRKSAAARPASAAADAAAAAAAADERHSDGGTWGAMISRDGFFFTMRTTRDGKRGTPHGGYYLSSPSWHLPASRAAQAGTQNELIRTMNHPPGFVRVPRGALPRSHSPAARLPRGRGRFDSFFRDRVQCHLRGNRCHKRVGRVASHGSQLLSRAQATRPRCFDLSCAIVRPPCVKTGYCNSLLG